jgi:hypothetical protein
MINSNFFVYNCWFSFSKCTLRIKERNRDSRHNYFTTFSTETRVFQNILHSTTCFIIWLSFFKGLGYERMQSHQRIRRKLLSIWASLQWRHRDFRSRPLLVHQSDVIGSGSHLQRRSGQDPQVQASSKHFQLRFGGKQMFLHFEKVNMIMLLTCLFCLHVNVVYSFMLFTYSCCWEYILKRLFAFYLFLKLIIFRKNNASFVRLLSLIWYKDFLLRTNSFTTFHYATLKDTNKRLLEEN